MTYVSIKLIVDIIWTLLIIYYLKCVKEAIFLEKKNQDLQKEQLGTKARIITNGDKMYFSDENGAYVEIETTIQWKGHEFTKGTIRNKSKKKKTSGENE